MRAKIIGVLLLGSILAWLALRQASLERRLDALIIEHQQTVDESVAQQERYEQLKTSVDRAAARQSVPVAGAESVPARSAMNQAAALQPGQPNAQGYVIQPANGPAVAEYDPTRPPPVNANALAEATTQEVRPKRSWGEEQATGAPDTTTSGDIPTAWASREPNGGPEWLALEYQEPLDLAEVRIRETFNPGAIAKVTAVVNGQEVTLWEGVASGGTAPRDFVVPVNQNISAQSIVVHLDTTRVQGWNEIDAVEIVGRDGRRQWATSTTASSTYAEPRVANSDTTVPR